MKRIPVKIQFMGYVQWIENAPDDELDAMIRIVNKASLVKRDPNTVMVALPGWKALQLIAKYPGFILPASKELK